MRSHIELKMKYTYIIMAEVGQLIDLYHDFRVRSIYLSEMGDF